MSVEQERREQRQNEFIRLFNTIVIDMKDNKPEKFEKFNRGTEEALQELIGEEYDLEVEDLTIAWDTVFAVKRVLAESFRNGGIYP